MRPRRPKQYCLQLYIYIYKKKFIKPVQHALKGFRVFLHNKFRKPVKGKNRELRLVFLTDINNSASFISISRRILFLTTDYCSLTMRVFIEFWSFTTRCNVLHIKEFPRGGYSLVRAKWGCAASQGMFFGIFALNRVLNLSFFVLIRVMIYQFLS